MSALRMVRVPLDGPKLMALGLRRGLPSRDVDLGYLIHCALVELFGADNAPKPFSFPTGGAQGSRVIPVLGYTEASAEVLRSHAQSFAEPGVHGLCLWDELADKAMPESFTVGARLGFSVRTCPVVRRSKPGVNQEQRGAEVDAFLARCRREGPEAVVSREEVYVDWLRAEFERRGGAMLAGAGLKSFQREKLFRRRAPGEDGGRTTKSTERPDALLEGTLTVTDPAGFTELLRRGVGRHRAFGFGMLLLRPAGPT